MAPLVVPMITGFNLIFGGLHLVYWDSEGGAAALRGSIFENVNMLCSVEMLSNSHKHLSWLAVVFALLLAASTTTAYAQQGDPEQPVVVQPGAPGKPSKTLPPDTTGKLPPRAHADVEFMQGMILHHQQAVEMTALIVSHTENKELSTLGARISSSQADEIKFMKRWLTARGEPVSMSMEGMQHHAMLMPGMLTPQQMEALRKAKGAEFDHLFLTGMIQHHNGALAMVKDLFDTAGAGQDAELFDFATDADNTQRAEIRVMETMLEKKK